MRRQKCDRQIPCGRCLKRGEGDKCTREWPGQYDPKIHRIYPRSDPAAPRDTSPPALEVGGPELKPPNAGDRLELDAEHRPSPSLNGRLSQQRPSSRNADVENAATVLGLLSWGGSKLADFDVKVPDLLKEPHQSGKYDGNAIDWELENAFGGTGAAQMSFLQLLMPSRKQVFDMVEYHERSILWYHGCYHGPTFQRELLDVYQSPSGFQVRSCDLRWLALLFAIMAGTMTCASRQIAESWGFQRDERAKLTIQWYKAAVTCLNLSNYMLRHHIYSVQAIATLTMSAHILGFSNEQSVLLGSALKIAQSIGLQRIYPDEDDVKYTPGHVQCVSSLTHRERLIKRETGRRLWSQICAQDWFSIPFSEMYSINKLHFSTSKPMNCDDNTMEPLSDSVPTNSSFGNYLYEIAALMPQIHDTVYASSTLYTKYQHVLEYDAKMRYLATDGLPPMFSMKEALDASWPDFIPWARRSLTLCMAHKIIMIHRGFLGRSFTNHAFAYTRRSCMTAAKTILKEAKQAYDEEGPLLWIDQAFMVAAGITLAMDVLHRSESEAEFAEHRSLVEHTINMLGKFENSMIATRGVRLLSSLLAEQARLAADQKLEDHRKRTQASGKASPSKRPKFDVPKFVESFMGNETFTQTLNTRKTVQEPNAVDGQSESQKQQPVSYDMNDQPDFSYEAFSEFFPPQTGISNAFLFEDLLNFDVV